MVSKVVTPFCLPTSKAWALVALYPCDVRHCNVCILVTVAAGQKRTWISGRCGHYQLQSHLTLLQTMANFRKRSHDKQEGGDGNSHEDLIGQISKFESILIRQLSGLKFQRRKGLEEMRKKLKESNPCRKTSPGQLSWCASVCPDYVFIFIFALFFRFSNQITPTPPLPKSLRAVLVTYSCKRTYSKT